MTRQDFDKEYDASLLPAGAKEEVWNFCKDFVVPALEQSMRQPIELPQPLAPVTQKSDDEIWCMFAAAALSNDEYPDQSASIADEMMQLRKERNETRKGWRGNDT